VFPQTWFQTADFGAGLPAVFRKAWGFIYEENIAKGDAGAEGFSQSEFLNSLWSVLGVVARNWAVSDATTNPHRA
jgi:endoglucanase